MSDPISEPKLLIVCGPSSSGKSSLIRRLIENFPANFSYSVSHTTRQPRPGEKPGIDYFFVTEAEMQKDIADGKFIEHAKYNQNFYGTSCKAVEILHEKGKVCVLDIDVQGVKQVKKKADLKAWYVFIKPPTADILEKRLRDRLTESEDSIKSRLEISKKEIEYGESIGHFDTVIVNDKFDTAYEQLRKFVVKVILN